MRRDYRPLKFAKWVVMASQDHYQEFYSYYKRSPNAVGIYTVNDLVLLAIKDKDALPERLSHYDIEKLTNRDRAFLALRRLNFWPEFGRVKKSEPLPKKVQEVANYFHVSIKRQDGRYYINP